MLVQRMRAGQAFNGVSRTALVGRVGQIGKTQACFAIQRQGDIGSIQRRISDDLSAIQIAKRRIQICIV